MLNRILNVLFYLAKWSLLALGLVVLASACFGFWCGIRPPPEGGTMPTPTRKPRPIPMPNKSLNFRLWIEGNRAPVVCQRCKKVVMVLTEQAVNILPLLKEHRCIGEEPPYGS